MFTLQRPIDEVWRRATSIARRVVASGLGQTRPLVNGNATSNLGHSSDPKRCGVKVRLNGDSTARSVPSSSAMRGKSTSTDSTHTPS